MVVLEFPETHVDEIGTSNFKREVLKDFQLHLSGSWFGRRVGLTALEKTDGAVVLCVGSRAFNKFFG